MRVLKKIINILSHRERNQIYILLFAIIIMALVDMLGVASILPFMSVITNPELIETNIFLLNFYQKTEKLGVSSVQDFIFFLGCTTFFLLIFSIFFKALTTYIQVRFILKVEYSLGARLISGYLHQPYEWFLNRNSSELGKNILSQISQVTQGPMLYTINLIAHSVVAIALIILVIVTDPILAFTMASIFFFSYVIIYFFTRPLLKRKGSETLKANELRFKVVNEAFSAVKEVKVGGLENFYVKRFENPAKIFTDNAAFSNILGLLPRYFLETIAFGGLILIVIILISRGENFNSVAPTLVLYAFVGYRLLPALQAIYFSTSQIRFSAATLDSLHKDLMNLNCYQKKETKIISMPITKSIALKNVYFFYPNTERVSLEDINFIIPAYSRVGIVGSTGSGKTTVVDVILGLLNPQRGKLFVDDNSITNANKRSWQKSIGYVPQQIYLADDTVSSNIAFGVEAKYANQSLIERAAKIANLHEFVINELPESYNTVIGERGVRLSGGQRQRIGIARALYHNPQLLIFDEATSALDNITEQAVIEAIKNIEKKITIILIAHRLNTVKNCDNIYLMEKGKIEAQGTYNELIVRSKKFQNMASL